MPAPELSVVIPARDGAATIAAQLHALAQQDLTRPWEVIVVDNGSTDDTVDVALAHGSDLDLRVVRCDRRGVNAARNTGMRAARADRVLFCDADDEVRPAWARRLGALLDEHDAAGTAVDRHLINVHSGLPRPDATAGVRPVRAPVVEFLPYPVGASCGVRRSAWETVGGFDESYRIGGDEMEFFWRLQVAGFDFGFDAEPLVDYRLPTRLGVAIRKGFGKGRVSARTYRAFRPRGARFRPTRALLLWVGLIARSYRLVSDRHLRADWLIRAAQSCGRLVGGVQHRVCYF